MLHTPRRRRSLALPALLAVCLLGGSGWLVPSVRAEEGAPPKVPAKPEVPVKPKGPVKPKLESTSAAPTRVAGWAHVPLPAAAQKGIKWLIISQNADGGWSQEGALQKKKPSVQMKDWQKSDVGNTSFALLAILATGSRPARGTFQGPLLRGVSYLLREMEAGPKSGPAITRREGTQIQGKIGRYADTYLAARVLLEVDGSMPDKRRNARVHAALLTVIGKIQAGQGKDGSWNGDAGWAPIHSTAYASQALALAQQRGLPVRAEVLDRAERFTVRQLKEQARKARPAPPPTRRRRGRPPVVTPSGGPSRTDLAPISVGGAGIVLYSLSQGIEQLSRTPAQRKRYAQEIKQIQTKVSEPRVMKGFGSVGGEEFISYANIALAFARLGTREAASWIARTGSRLEKIQNRDGSWSGHHCITGRTAVTGLAVMTLTAERQVPRRTK